MILIFDQMIFIRMGENYCGCVDINFKLSFKSRRSLLKSNFIMKLFLDLFIYLIIGFD